jgi:hypothetical protein
LALQHTLAQQKRKRVADSAAAAVDDAMDGDSSSFNSAANNIPSSSSLSALSVEQGRSALAQFVVQRIFFNPEPDPAAPGLGEPRLVRLVRMQMNGPSAPSSSSSSLSSASPSSSSGAGGSTQSVPVIESFVRASDLCMTVLNSKSSVHALIRDFNQPYEKTLLRLPGSGAGRAEVYCLTRKGVQRFALTKKVSIYKHRNNQRSYEPGVAFAFTVTGCNDRCYFVPPKAAEVHGLVGANARKHVRLRHPYECKPGDKFAEFLLPKPKEETPQ